MRLNKDQRLLLDSLRQYLGAVTESQAGAVAVVTAVEQLLACYLADGSYPARCSLLLAALNAVASASEPAYQVDSENRLLRWHGPSNGYLPIPAAAAPWLLSS
ncbi:MAG TPA: hypothetical protein VNT01_01215 [Symbiobacteriaceae bacterium]|nr:hypothetical protein [Symbiobacteriaceae bacterium]